MHDLPPGFFYKNDTTCDSGGAGTQSLVLCVVFGRSLFVLLYFLLLAIVLFVLLPLSPSDYPFGIFTLVVIRMYI